MPIMERDVVLTGKENGTHTIDLPITALKNVEDTADVKAKPAEGDYIPLMDSADNMQMKKVLVSALKELFSIVVDAELSAASENPVQNKVLEAALKLKAAASHMHSAGDINSGVLPAARGGTGTTSIAGLTQAIATALTGSADLAGQLSAAMGACKIQTGSYTGTGTYGSANPCSLTFDFVPRIMALMRNGSLFSQSSNGLSYQILTPFVLEQQIGSMMSDGTYGIMGTSVLVLSWNGKSVTWYAKSSNNAYYVTAYSQANVAGQTYHYLALG